MGKKGVRIPIIVMATYFALVLGSILGRGGGGHSLFDRSWKVRRHLLRAKGETNDKIGLRTDSLRFQSKNLSKPSNLQE